MPTTYTHYRFGKDVLSCLSLPLRNSILEKRELYDIGLHGPDIFFYYKAMRNNPVNQIGYRIHDRNASEFFLNAKKMIEKSPDKAAARAYQYGFVCHFVLDSICHPYVEKMEKTSGLSHSEIEMEFDRTLLIEDHYDPLTYPMTRHIHPTKENAAVLTPFFGNVTEQEVQKAMKGMIFYHKFFQLQNDNARKLLFLGMKLSKIYDNCHGMIISKEPNPNCFNYCLLLKKLYAEAISTAASLIRRYQDVLFDKAELPARFEQTFGAGDHWEQLPL